MRRSLTIARRVIGAIFLGGICALLSYDSIVRFVNRRPEPEIGQLIVVEKSCWPSVRMPARVNGWDVVLQLPVRYMLRVQVRVTDEYYLSFMLQAPESVWSDAVVGEPLPPPSGALEDEDEDEDEDEEADEDADAEETEARASPTGTLSRTEAASAEIVFDVSGARGSDSDCGVGRGAMCAHRTGGHLGLDAVVRGR